MSEIPTGNGPRISLVQSGVDFAHMVRIWRSSARPQRLDTTIHKTNVAILRPVASALRKAAKKQNKSFNDPRSGGKQRGKPRSARIQGNIRIYKSKRHKMESRLRVNKKAFWGAFLEAGTKTRKGRGKILANRYASNVYKNEEPGMLRKLKNEYESIFVDIILKGAARSHKRKILI